MLANLMENLTDYLLLIPASLIALTVHEYAHGYVAYRMGDPTARSLGRLTLNPLKHLDPIGVLCMVFFRFGWAKPVPINPRYFQNPKKGMALTAAAGPISNFILAFISALLFILIGKSSALFPGFYATNFGFYFFFYLSYFFLLFHYLNLSLCFFNLLPFPPLDGSRIFNLFLPDRWYFKIMRYEKYIQIALLIALWFGAFSGVLSAAIGFFSNLIFSFLYLFPFLA